MKKLLFLILPLLILVSCQKNEYVVPNRTIIVDLAPTTWYTVNGKRNYIAEINLPELTNEFNQRGGVLAYLSFGERTYEQLPQVYGGVSYSYVTQPGKMILELESADGVDTVSPPSQAVTVKIVLVESEYY